MRTLVISIFLSFQNSAQQSVIEMDRRETALHSVPEVLGRESRNTPAAMRKVAASVHERLFEAKFNQFIYALMEFANDYKSRQTINVRKAKAVREAWLQLQQTEALFRDKKKSESRKDTKNAKKTTGASESPFPPGGSQPTQLP